MFTTIMPLSKTDGQAAGGLPRANSIQPRVYSMPIQSGVNAAALQEEQVSVRGENAEISANNAE
jgi:hypothetical protein